MRHQNLDYSTKNNFEPSYFNVNFVYTKQKFVVQTFVWFSCTCVLHSSRILKCIFFIRQWIINKYSILVQSLNFYLFSPKGFLKNVVFNLRIRFCQRLWPFTVLVKVVRLSIQSHICLLLKRGKYFRLLGYIGLRRKPNHHYEDKLA